MKRSLVKSAIAGGALLATLLHIGCGKATSFTPLATSAGLPADTPAFTVDSAVATINSALNESEHVSSYAWTRLRKKTLLEKVLLAAEEEAIAGACDGSRFSPSLGASSCSGTTGNDTVTSTFSNCTAGPNNEFVLNGRVSLTFDSSQTCNTWIQAAGLPTSGSVTRTTSDFTHINANGSRVTAVSDSHTNYLGNTISGGVKTSFGSGTNSIDVLGVHRTGVTANGDKAFDHSVYSTQTLTVTGALSSNNRKVTAGSITVDHNLARYSVTASLNGLTWGSSSCCHPTSGSITFTLSGSVSGTIAANFNTGNCGTVALTMVDGTSATYSLTSCE